MKPHVSLAGHALSGRHATHWLARQTCPEAHWQNGSLSPMHVLQFNVPPHPSEARPHVACCAAHVVGMHPQTFGVPPPPQFSGLGHDPQLTVPPQPSGAVPQF
jgi:hypothetical protein